MRMMLLKGMGKVEEETCSLMGFYWAKSDSEGATFCIPDSKVSKANKR